MVNDSVSGSSTSSSVIVNEISRSHQSLEVLIAFSLSSPPPLYSFIVTVPEAAE